MEAQSFSLSSPMNASRIALFAFTTLRSVPFDMALPLPMHSFAQPVCLHCPTWRNEMPGSEGVGNKER